MSGAAFRPLHGASARRREDPRLLRGQARFLDDLPAEGAAHVAFLRSSHAHARLRAVRVVAARTLPGVLAVVSADDLAGVPPLLPRIEAEGCHTPPRPLLADGVARFAGEPIVAVVAESRYLAEDACALVEVDYDPLPILASTEQAMEGATLVHSEVPGNVYFQSRLEAGEVDRAFAQAAVIVEARLRSPRQAASPLEGRGVLATYDARTDSLRVWSSTQVPHTLQRVLAAALGMPRQRVQVSVPEVGGGFGLKAHVFPEEGLVAWLARELGRPVKWVEDRREALLASAHARDTVVVVRAAATAQGELLAVEARVVCDQGAYPAFPYGAILEPMGTAAMIPGPYRLEHYRYDTYAVATNRCPEGAYRGVGMPVASLVHERVMDLLAARLGLDPAEVRRRNLLRADELPYATASGMVYDSGRYHDGLALALERLGYAQLRAEQPALRAAGRHVGLGLGCYVEYTGMGPATFKRRGMAEIPGYDAARVALLASGRLVVSTSLPAMGQGLETTFAQLAGQALGVDAALVDVRQTDTAEAPEGTGCFASRSAVAGGGAIAQACAALRERITAAAARRLEASLADLELEAGEVRVRGVPTRRMTLAELAASLAPASPDAVALEAVERYDPPVATFASGAHATAVEVDPETGVVCVLRYVVAEDCGRLINPAIVDGQVRGAATQGLGAALLEELRYAEDAQLLAGSFMDYLLPAAVETPSVEVAHLETPSPQVPGGHKGVGEGGTIGALPALANAIADALRPLGAELPELPASPERIRAALSRAVWNRIESGRVSGASQNRDRLEPGQFTGTERRTADSPRPAQSRGSSEDDQVGRDQEEGGRDGP